MVLTSEMAATVPASGLSSCCYCAVAVAAEDSAVETVAVATMTVSGSSWFSSSPAEITMAAVAAAVVNRGILRDSLASSLVREFLLSVV